MLLTYTYVYMRTDGTNTIVSSAGNTDQAHNLYSAIHPRKEDGRVDCEEFISWALFNEYRLRKGKSYARYRNSVTTEYISVTSDGLTH